MTAALIRTAVLFSVFLVTLAESGLHGIKGTYQTCENEGEKVILSKEFMDNPCITHCMCKDRRMTCEWKSCPGEDGCYSLIAGSKNICCHTCRGCWHDGRHHESGSKWRDARDACRQYFCKAGVVTSTQVQCHATCEHPHPPRDGQCCPACHGCYFQGSMYDEGQEVTLKDDPCVTCQCTNGSMSCSKKACPVLACPPDRTSLDEKGCCLKCHGKRKPVYRQKNKCLLGKKYYRDGQHFRLDICTTCHCTNTTAVCERISCPVLDCPTDMHELRDKSCCPSCRQTLGRQCIYMGNVYKSGEEWHLDACTECKCSDGNVTCSEQSCPLETRCPKGQHPERSPGDCCQKCVEDDATCTVYGDPHYRTFDGREYDFQGACKYILSQDCHSQLFQIKVKNDARSTPWYSWTRTVSLKLEGMKVTLTQRRRVKVNGVRVRLPYIRLGVLSIFLMDNNMVVVRVDLLGLKLEWDGDSFLEVTAPPKFKDKLCGLCGNYNDNKKDDFRTKTGEVVGDPEEFGNSWRTGGERACTRRPVQQPRLPLCDRRREVYLWGLRQCNKIKLPVFEECRDKVGKSDYFRSCMMDMCECPGGQCYCSALTAFSHACKKTDAYLDPNWRDVTGCTRKNKCPRGSVFRMCGSGCIKTCKNHRRQCRRRSCVPGCYCPEGFVVHRRKCIRLEDCPYQT